MIKPKSRNGRTDCLELLMTEKTSIIIKNIYYMFSYAHSVLRQKAYESIETETFDNTQDLFANILDKGVSVQLKRGLSRDYNQNHEALSVLRGKIDIDGSMRQIIQNKRRLCCIYDEFSEDILMNRILKTTLKRLIYCNDVKSKTRDSIKKSLLFFSNVKTIEPSQIKWNSLKYHKNNATYRMLMNICYLTLQSLLLSTKPGKQKMAVFLDDQAMYNLYEKFILEYYKYHYPDYSPSSKYISWDVVGEEKYLPSMKSDILLSYKDRKLIIDAKYYSETMQKQHGTHSIHSNNLYQIFAYVKNEDKTSSGKVSGMLLYAKTDETLTPNFDYMLSGNHISAKTLDLNVSFNIIKMQLNSIIDKWKNKENSNAV